jgi:NhaP-type Na+/H+ or K+/H+ antiporter
VVRPLSGWIGLAGAGLPNGERGVISFFGIRGLGTAYYLAYGLGHGPFDDGHVVWAAAGLTILVSILLHGATVTPVMRRLERRRSG